MFCGLMIINKDRRIAYHVTKLSLPSQDRDALFKMISTLAQNKMTMQKAPITIEEDLINLEKDSNAEITKLLEQLEAFFEPISAALGPIIDPPNDDKNEEVEVVAAGAKGGKVDPKAAAKDDKAKAAKAPPPKGGKGPGGDA